MRQHATRSSRTCLAALLAASFAVLASNPAALAAGEPGEEALGRASAAVGRGDYALAEKELSSIKSGKERVDALLGVARLQLLTGRYDAAMATARTAAGLGKDARNEAAAIKGEALAAQGKIAEAIAALKEVEAEDGARRARLLLGELLIRQGKRAEAKAPLMTLIDDYNADKITSADALGLTMVGRAAHLLRSPRDANDAFNAAEKAGGKKIVETLLDRAELFLDKYNPGDAGNVVKEALKLAPRDPRAHLAMAKVKLENSMDFEAAESEVRQALDVNPNLAAAYFVRAGLALRDLDIAAADQAADKGLSLDPSDLELHAMKAAIRFLADDKPGFEAWKQKTFARNPGYSTFYQIVGEYAEWEHRYDDIVRMMGEATTVDKNDAKAYATLGLNLIRSGDDDGGVQALKTAWNKDKYNVRVYNTLNLFEKDIPTEYVTVKGPRFNIRYAKDEKAILERYVPRMLDEAWSSMVERYGFTPQTPVSIELYADTQAFSIRTSGLPNVGIQGVCFGKTLAAMSPSAGPFNWGNVLWHELGHVFAIQMSKNHVPRWFTEGLSEYETIVRRPEWQREEDPALFAALKAGRIPPVDGFNRAFTHVDSVEDVTMAYYAASQILVFAAKEFGFPKVVSMLPRWGAGERTAQVVQESLGIGPEELDRRFRAWLKPHLERYTKQYVPDLHTPPLDDARKNARANPSDAKRQVELALALFSDGQKPEGEAVLAEALRLDPKQPDAHFVKLRLAIREKNAAEAERLVAKMIADGNDGYAVRMKAADLAEHKKDVASEKQNLEAAHKLDPTQVEPLQGLYDLAHKSGDKDAELWALSHIALLDQHDRKVWNLLLEHQLEVGNWEEARKVGESLMFIDVHNWKAHRLYARALARTGNFVSAVYELNSALVCHPKLPKDQADIYGALAKTYEKLKEPEMAAKALEYQKQIAAAPAPGPGPEPKPGRHQEDPQGT
jgi:tetratricopeptide (TPR) repeat protein